MAAVIDQLIEEIKEAKGMTYEKALEYVLSLPKDEIIDDINAHHNRID